MNSREQMFTYINMGMLIAILTIQVIRLILS